MIRMGKIEKYGPRMDLETSQVESFELFVEL
jgi:hypothetical protein